MLKKSKCVLQKRKYNNYRVQDDNKIIITKSLRLQMVTIRSSQLTPYTWQEAYKFGLSVPVPHVLEISTK